MRVDGAKGLSGAGPFLPNGPLRGRALSQPPAAMAPHERDGGPGCRGPGPASRKVPATCCKRPWSPGPARAVRPNGAVTKARCLACAGLAQLSRARKRPAAAKAKGKGKAKAAPKVTAAAKAHAAPLAAVPKATAGMASPQAAAAPVALAGVCCCAASGRGGCGATRFAHRRSRAGADCRLGAGHSGSGCPYTRVGGASACRTADCCCKQLPPPQMWRTPGVRPPWCWHAWCGNPRLRHLQFAHASDMIWRKVAVPTSPQLVPS